MIDRDTITLPRFVLEQALEALWTTPTGEIVIKALRSALEQQEVVKDSLTTEEPVAWAVMQDGAICWEADYPFSNEPGWCDSDQQSVPLYTNPPPKRQPLTDEEILMVLYAADIPDLPRDFKDVDIDIARAIERAHGIGDEE